MKFVSPHCQEAQSDQNTFTEKTGGCLNRLIGDKKKTKHSELQKVFFTNDGDNRELKNPSDHQNQNLHFRNKILDFFSVNSEHSLLSH